MFYKKAIAFSVAAMLALSVGCNFSSSDNDENAIKVPVGSSATNGDITLINGENMDEPPTEEEKITIRMALYNGSSSLSAAHLLENSQTNVAYEKYSYTNFNTVEEVKNALENNEADVATMPLNEAAKLYNTSGGKFKVCLINSMFNYCIAENGNSITDISNLAGKTVTISESDEISKIVLDKILSDYNISNCTISTVKDNKAIVDGLSNGSIKVAMTQVNYISEASNNNANVVMAIDLYDSWYEYNDADVVTGCLVASNDFINSNKKAFVYFMKDYDASVTITKKNIDESSQLAEKYGLASSAKAAKSAIPGCSITTKTGSDMIDISGKFLNFVNSVNPDAIGAILPDNNFYYNEQY
ncbi:MAG: ABC transporter substrate-binding protein [Lachnospirales bacterium]